ncbi:MAG: hypothetical protein JST61_10485 [Acidobacteria bacterium]|nr:hypothetical protein [Acidobacteriota bacterium]
MKSLFDLKRIAPPTEEHLGDAEFLPVVIAASVALVVILVAAIVVVAGTGKHLVPQDKTQHPVSQIVMSQPANMA